MGRTAVMVGTLLAAGGLLVPPAIAQQESDDEQTVTAKVAACYVGQDLQRPGELECANLCMELGAALVLVGETATYVPVNENGEGAATLLVPFNDQTVKVTGTVAEGDGCPTLTLASVEEDIPPARVASAVLASTLITAEDLEGAGNMSLYQLLRQHARLRFELISGAGEVVFCEEREALDMDRYRGCAVYVNDSRSVDAVETLRGIRVSRVQRVEILRRTEASSRLGGHGQQGAILIRLKR